MPETLNKYVVQQRPIRPMLDLGIVQNTLATITAGNKEALQTQSALRTAIANMDLNEAEDGFRQALFDDITKTIDDNAIEGNAYYALDDIIKKQGDIGSNPGLLGRLKAQQAYKAYQTQVDARQDINQDTKEWAKELNPYSYQDKVDPITGKVIGGTEWTPGFTPVSDIDLNALFAAITKQLTPLKGGWSGASSYLYDDGTTGNKLVPGKTVGVYSTSHGSYERLTKKMISDAINAAFQNDPKLAASAKQAYDVLNWKADKGDLISDFEKGVDYNGAGGLFTKSGRRKTYNEYMADMVDDYAAAHAYNHTTGGTDYKDAAVKSQYAIKHGGGGSGGSGGTASIMDSPEVKQRAAVTGPYEAKYSDFGVASREYDETSARVCSGLANLGIKLDKLPNSPQELQNIINSKEFATDTDRKIAQSYVNYYKDQYDKFFTDWNNLDGARAADGTKVDAATDISDKLSRGISLDTLADSKNPYTKEYINKYNDLIEKAYGGTNYVGFEAKSEAALNKLLGKMQLTADDAKTEGYIVDSKRIWVPKERAELLNNLTQFAQGIKGNYRRWDGDTNHNPTELTRGFWGMIGSTDPYGGLEVQNLNPDSAIYRGTFEQGFNRFNKSLNAVQQEEINRKLDNLDKTLYVPMLFSTGANPSEIYNMHFLETTGEEAYGRMAKAARNDFENIIAGNYSDTEIRVQSEGSGPYNIADANTKKQIMEELRTLDFNKTPHKYYVAQIDGLGLRHAMKYSYDEKDHNGTKHTINRNIVLDAYEDDPDMKFYNSTPNVINKNYIISHWLENQPVALSKTNDLIIDAYPIQAGIDNNFQWVVRYNGDFDMRNAVTLNNNEVNQLSLCWQYLVDQRNKPEMEAILQNEDAFGKYAYDLITEYPALEKIFRTQGSIGDYIVSATQR